MDKKRLTIEEILNCYSFHSQGRKVGKTLLFRTCNELTEYKKIEQELGIDFITLNKIFQQGLYYKKEAFVSFIDTMSCLKKGVIYYAPNEDIHCELFGKYSKPQMGASITIFVPPRNAYYSLTLADYGKTWALTKEELEK